MAEPGGRQSDNRPSAVMLTDPRRALVLSGILLAAGVVVCFLVWITAVRTGVQWVDDRVLSGAKSIRNGPTTAVAKALSFLGGTWCSFTVRALVVAILVVRRHWTHLAGFVLAVVTSEIMIGTLKSAYDRPRPAHGLVVATSGSFPSGHAVAAAVTAVGLVIALLPPGHTRWVWERQAALYASAMAISRVYLGVHWLSDVVGGALLGSAIAIGWPALLVLWRHRPEPETTSTFGADRSG